MVKGRKFYKRAIQGLLWKVLILVVVFSLPINAQKLKDLPRITTFNETSRFIIDRNDSTKAIQWRYIFSVIKDSINSAIGTATTEIIDSTSATDSSLSAQIALRATIIALDDSSFDLRSAINLKASTTLVNALGDTISTVSAGLDIETGNRITGDSTLTASLTLYAKRDSIIGYINILPDSIKISASHIILDGDVVATSLTGKTVTGAVIQTDTTGQRVKIQNPSIIFENAFAKTVDLRSSGTSERPTLTVDLGIGGVMEVSNDLSVTGNITKGGNSVATEAWVSLQGYMTSLPSHNNSYHSETYLTSSTESWRATDVTAIGASLTNTGGTLSVTGYNNSNWDAAYNNQVTGISFGTTTGIITLTQQDSGTLTVDLDGRWIASGDDVPAGDVKAGSGLNSPAYFDGSGYLALGSVTAPITITAGAIGITQAATAANGYLSSTDWNTFNGKANAFTGYTGEIDFFDQSGGQHILTYSNGILSSYSYIP